MEELIIEYSYTDMDDDSTCIATLNFTTSLTCSLKGGIQALFSYITELSMDVLWCKIQMLFSFKSMIASIKILINHHILPALKTSEQRAGFTRLPLLPLK